MSFSQFRPGVYVWMAGAIPARADCHAFVGAGFDRWLDRMSAKVCGQNIHAAER
jgi:hypothetical protein